MEFDLDKAVQILERTPTVLEYLLKDLPPDLTLANEGGNSWSPYDVLGHLIHGEKTDWLVRTEIILKGDNTGKFEPFDRFAQLNDSLEKTLEELLSEFQQLRKENLQLLKSKTTFYLRIKENRRASGIRTSYLSSVIGCLGGS